LLNEKGYICFVDVFMRLGYLSKSDYENWRFKRVSPLERVLHVNLARIHFIMKTVRRNSFNGHLQPSMTVYKSWGKDKKTLLQFSKSGDPTIETAYACIVKKLEHSFVAGVTCQPSPDLWLAYKAPSPPYSILVEGRTGGGCKAYGLEDIARIHYGDG